MSASQWEFLSSRAAAMLVACNPSPVDGHSAVAAQAFLREAGCPAFPPFVRYLTSYAGLSVAFSRATVRSRLQLVSIGDGAQCVQNKEDDWRLLFATSTESHEGYWMKPDGSVYMAFFSGRQFQQVISGSVEVFLEDLAMRWWAATNNFVLDSVSTSVASGAAMIAEKYKLGLVPEGTDQYIQWWASSRLGVGNYPLLGKRYRLTAYWPSDAPDLEAELTQELSRLLEPHLGQLRGSAEYKQYRDTGDFMRLAAVVEPDQSIPPAKSFRIAARSGLAQLADQHRFPPPPETDEAFRHYLESNLSLFSRLGNREVLYYVAVGMVALGHLEWVEQLLDNLPGEGGSDWAQPMWAAAFLGFLFPNQFLFSPLDDVGEFRFWLANNRQNLSWDEQRGVYDNASF
jgi:hypothetical protein